MKFLALGENAASFYDASTGLYIGDKKVHPIAEGYFNTKKVKTAVAGGHLVLKTYDEYTHQEDSEEMEDFVSKDVSKEGKVIVPTVMSTTDRFNDLFNKGFVEKQLISSFTKEELIEVAENFEIKAEEADTKTTLVKAILEELTEERK